MSVKLSGPGTEIGGDDTEVTLDSESGQQFNDFITLVKGKKLDSIPESHIFGMALITYTTKYDEQIKAEGDMQNLVSVFERNGISVNYGS